MITPGTKNPDHQGRLDQLCIIVIIFGGRSGEGKTAHEFAFYRSRPGLTRTRTTLSGQREKKGREKKKRRLTRNVDATMVIDHPQCRLSSGNFKLYKANQCSHNTYYVLHRILHVLHGSRSRESSAPEVCARLKNSELVLRSTSNS